MALGVKNLKAKFRYRQEDSKVFHVIIDKTKKNISIEFEPQLAITPGQQLVLYENDKCIGGAIINKIFFNNKEIKLLNYSIE